MSFGTINDRQRRFLGDNLRVVLWNVSRNGMQVLLCIVVAAFLFVCPVASTSAFGAAPEITHLFPAGIQRGAKATVTCNGKFEWPLKVWSPDATVEVGEKSGQISVTVPSDFASDRVWLRFYNDDGAAAPIPFLVGNLREANEVEPNDAPTNAQKLAEIVPPPGDTDLTINGVLEKRGDVDSFAISLTAGQTLVAAIAANTYFGSPIDSILQVVSTDGTVLAESHDDIGLDPRLAFACQKTGTYVVRTFAFPSNPNQTIDFHGGSTCVYRLTLTTGPYITHALETAVARQPSSNIVAGDASPSTVEVRGWNIPQGMRVPVVSLGESRLQGGNAKQGQNNAGFQHNAKEFEPSAIADNFPSRIGFVQVPRWAGSTRIRLASHEVTGIAQTSHEQQQRLIAPTALSGCIRQRSDRDYFRLAMKKGDHIVVTVEAVSLDSHLVPLVRLTDPEGKVVADEQENGAAKDVTISHKAGHDGEYLLTVRDRYDGCGDRHFYRLTFQPQRSDFRLSLSADSIVLESGKPCEIPVTIKRIAGGDDGIKDISLVAVDLPDGVSCSSVVSSSEGETASKVTLKLEATDASFKDVSFSGPIRIRGTAVDSKQERFALTPEKFKVSFDQLWLTVPLHADEASGNAEVATNEGGDQE